MSTKLMLITLAIATILLFISIVFLILSNAGIA